MLVPGRIHCGQTVRIPVNYQDANGVDIDPETVTFKLYSPDAVTTSYVYGTNAQLVKRNAGDYYVDVTPAVAGRWFYRWVSTGTDQASAIEGNFVVQWSPFFDRASDAYAV